MSDVESLVTAEINKRKVVVISKASCPHCKRVKEELKKILKDLSDYYEWEISRLPNCAAIQKYLGKLTGASTVPRVFINGKCIGGADDTVAAIKNGKLSQMLKN